MSRLVPTLMRVLPDRLKGIVWSRLYLGKERPEALYRDAPLSFAPGVTMDLVPGDVISSSIAHTGFWELHLTRHLVRLAREGGTMIDIGANLGYFSLVWAAANPANRCISIEASPRNAPLLRNNVERNRLGDRITVMAVAAGRERGTLDFDVGPFSQTGWGGFTAERGETTVSVDVVRVDEAIDTADRIRLLKVDIEGADAWALEGCERLLKSKRVDNIWFEQNKPRMAALGIAEDEAQRFLESMGYACTPKSDTSKGIVDWSAVPRA